MEALRDALLAGRVAVIPTETVAGLAAIATNKDAVEKIRVLKGRPAGRFLAVAFASLDQAEPFVEGIENLPESVKKNLPGPLSIVLKLTNFGLESLSAALAEDQSTISIRIPQAEWFRGLISEVGPLALTSANLHGQSEPTNVEDCKKQLGNYPFYAPVEWELSGRGSTVLDCTTDPPRILRPGSVSDPSWVG